MFWIKKKDKIKTLFLNLKFTGEENSYLEIELVVWILDGRKKKKEAMSREMGERVKKTDMRITGASEGENDAQAGDDMFKQNRMAQPVWFSG